MKPHCFASLNRVIALGVVALGFFSLSAKAQTMLTVENGDDAPPPSKKINLLVELELPADTAKVTANEFAEGKYRLHASDRVHRGSVEAEKREFESVLPELSAETPKAGPQKFFVVTHPPLGGE